MREPPNIDKSADFSFSQIAFPTSLSEIHVTHWLAHRIFLPKNMRKKFSSANHHQFVRFQNLHYMNLHVATQESIAAPGKLNLQDYQHVTSALSRIQVCLRLMSCWFLVLACLYGFVLFILNLFTMDLMKLGFFHFLNSFSRR